MGERYIKRRKECVKERERVRASDKEGEIGLARERMGREQREREKNQ